MPTSPFSLPKQFLFAMFQGSGNIPPILTMAKQLVARGHHVRILAGPGIDHPTRPVSAPFLEGIKTTGASLVPFEQPPDIVSSPPPLHGLPFKDAGSATWESPWTADDPRPLILVSFSTAPQAKLNRCARTEQRQQGVSGDILSVRLYNSGAGPMRCWTSRKE
jgi:hypothetical protein